MWEAQIKVVFPIIEKQRSIIVERYRKGIEALLPITGAYGEMFLMRGCGNWRLVSSGIARETSCRFRRWENDCKA